MVPASLKYLISSFILFYLVPNSGFCQVTFVIESLPNATPVNDTIFITGSFNNWSVNDPAYMLHKLPTGEYAITLDLDSGGIEYKFSRGSWMKIETDAQNQYLPNRVLPEKYDSTIEISVANWQDLGGARGLPIVVFYYFAVAFQCLLLIGLANRIPKRESRRFQAITILNVFLFLFFGFALWFSLSNLVVHASLITTGQVVLFLWGPAVFIFLNVFYGRVLYSKYFLMGIPALVFVATFFLRVNGVVEIPFLHGDINQGLFKANALVIGLGIFYSFSILTYCAYQFGFKVFSFFELESPERFLDVFLKVQFLILFLLTLNLALLYTGFTTIFLMDFHLGLLTVSALVFVEMYYLWRFPTILREPSKLVVEKVDADFFREKLDELMRIAKPYRDPELTLSRLSELLSTKPHVLSRVLNDYYHQNFRDYLNQKRVEEFIRLAGEDGKLHMFTYLALAHEVGFNSKSTFNLAFKKVTGKNPRDYFRSVIVVR